MRKPWITTAVILGMIPVLLVTLVGLAQLAVANQAAQASSTQPVDLPTGNPWVSVRMDETMFTLYAALNAAGYDKENFGLSYHPVRQLVRERLAGKRFTGQARLRAELQTIHPYNFVVWALHYGPPPEFARTQAGWSDPGIPAFLFFGLDSQLRSFYQEMDIASLWQEVRPQYEQEAARYQAAGSQAVQDVLDYTRLQNVPLKKVVIIPNLLAPNWDGKGPTVGGVAYVVVGPTEGKTDVSLVKHEVLHPIVGPLVEANMGMIDQEQASALYADLSGRVPASYGSWESIVEEQVVRAVECRLAGARCDRMLQNDEAEGFLLVRDLVANLANFEQGSSTLAEFMPHLLASLNDIELPAQ